MAKDTLRANLPDGTPAERRARGAVYTPLILAQWVARMLLRNPKQHERVLDLGCGDGTLLEPILSLAPSAELIGIELNAAAVRRAKHCLHTRTTILNANVLSPKGRNEESLESYWIRKMGARPDAIIMNPPWGAENSLSKHEARGAGLSLAAGQFDTYDLFCELSLQLLPKGGRYAFILPDSILMPEHTALRKLLVNRTTIDLIARLGEGVFHGVYRGCIIIVGSVELASKSHKVECVRLTKADRLELTSSVAFEAAQLRVGHFVPQSRFQADKDAHLDIDVRDEDEWVGKIKACGGEWTSLLESRRGVEISKSGRVMVCNSCGISRPAPKKASISCDFCGSKTNMQETFIVSKSKMSNRDWIPFIVGEDVCRYSVKPKRWIKSGIKGINYKNKPIGKKPRILVRKTGIGINAAIDTSNSYTNQVVFEYTIKSKIIFKYSYLHYVLGVLCSRAMFAFYLRSCGEIEWRSHPYMTQKMIAKLPVPIPESPWQIRQAKAIANAVELHLAIGGNDFEIESLVAGMLNLNDKEMSKIIDTINNADDMQHMRLLRISDAENIKPKRVD